MDNHTPQLPQLELQFTKLCECGCGKPTPIATVTSKAFGWVKGQPKRFVRGHRKKAPAGVAPNPSGICVCGCGQPTPLAKRTDKRCRTVEGQHVRFVQGHSRRKYNNLQSPNPSGLCMCGCGQKTTVAKHNNIKMGYAKGQPIRYIIGHSDGIKKAAAACKTHGMTSTKEYQLWLKIKRRCYAVDCIGYKDYGGRGIEMYQSWLDSFLEFRAYIMQLPDHGKEGYTLDRIDNNGNYEPGNVRWADRLTQSNNTRRNKFHEFNGEIHTITEWARIIGIPSKCLATRLKIGWTIEKTLTTPRRIR